MQCSARFLGQQVGVMLGLLLPDAAELVIDVAALRIEIIALAVAIQPHALLVAPVEELAERVGARLRHRLVERSEEHTSELQSLMRISYAVFCLKKKQQTTIITN